MPRGVYLHSKRSELTKQKISQTAKDIAQGIKKVEYISVEKVLKRARQGWTKWGGSNNSYRDVTPEWYCQACNEKQTDGLPSYLIKIQEGEYGRICSVCFHEAIVRKINNIFDLISFLRRVTPEF